MNLSTSSSINSPLTTQAFSVNTLEYGFGSLVRGVAYVQFCLVSAQGELLISETRWVGVI